MDATVKNGVSTARQRIKTDTALIYEPSPSLCLPTTHCLCCISICIHGTRHGVLMVVWGHGSTVDVICWPVVHRSWAQTHSHHISMDLINIDGMSTYVPTTGQAKRWRRAHGEYHPWNHTICGLPYQEAGEHPTK